ncbi:DUF1009 family protein/carbonic anhydrase/acetyltransferase-like protein (isoleucine patch superfamily) [Bradyrhizobium sp. LB7.2]
MTKLKIGSGCTIRESVTMNAGTVTGGGITEVGDRNYFMNCSHVGHDCHVGNDVIFATSATLGGHCEIGDFVFIGGLSAVHQFTRIGPQVMVGGVCGVRDDVIPFGLVNGQYAALEGLNLIGMKRRKFTKQRLATVRAFFTRNSSMGPAPLPNAWRRRGRSPVKIRRSPKSSTSSARASIARSVFPPSRSDDGMAAGMTSAASEISSPVGVIAGGGAMPFAVADSLAARGITPVLFPLRGACDPARVEKFRHRWISVGQLGRAMRLFREEGCRDLIFIGTLVRPSLSEVRVDFTTLRLLGNVIRAFRGGDDHLLSGVGRILEQGGFRMVGIRDVAPDLLMPEGCISRAWPSDTGKTDIERGRAVLTALGPFDIGQAAVVIDGHVVAVEDIEGTDALLARVARLREEGRIRAATGRGVLVKVPKSGQDLRFDLPTIGPRTLEGVAVAGLAGIAVVAGNTIAAEPQAMIAFADTKYLFVIGLPA